MSQLNEEKNTQAAVVDRETEQGVKSSDAAFRCVCGSWAHQHEEGTGACIKVGCDCTAFQPSNKDLTVEEALKELRELFPTNELFIVELIDNRIEPPEWYISIYSQPSNCKVSGPTLSEAMDQVRKWKESQ